MQRAKRILASIVLVAINPTKQLAQIRNTQRLSDINTIFKAIEQNTIDTGGAYPGTVGVYKDICPIGGVNTSCIDLSGLVPIYMAGIPVDPRGWNYKIGINPDNNRISIKASNSELGQNIVINEITMKVEYLIIGGGGGGSLTYSTHGGGGGAGGYRSSVFGEMSGGDSPAESRMTVSPQSYPIVVGAGGAGGDRYTNGSNGGNSSGLGITAIGGGGGGGAGSASGGGSGGGGRPTNQAGGSGTVNQGYSGGAAGTGGAGGGGGAGGAGSNGPAGNGGAGLTSSITGTPVARGGGGGGSGSGFANRGLGTAGGGNGAFASSSNGGGSGAGAANTGGGGGGAQYTDSGQAGGSGIVIIRYRTEGPNGTVSATGGTKTTVGEYTIHTFTTSGTFTLIEY
jgi:hypothetical protein